MPAPRVTRFTAILKDPKASATHRSAARSPRNSACNETPRGRNSDVRRAGIPADWRIHGGPAPDSRSARSPTPENQLLLNASARHFPCSARAHPTIAGSSKGVRNGAHTVSVAGRCLDRDNARLARSGAVCHCRAGHAPLRRSPGTSRRSSRKSARRVIAPATSRRCRSSPTRKCARGCARSRAA